MFLVFGGFHILPYPLSKEVAWFYYRNIQDMHTCCTYSQSIWKSWINIYGGTGFYNIWRISSTLAGVLVSWLKTEYKGLYKKKCFVQTRMIFWKTKIFQNFCLNFTGKVFLEVYSNKSNFIQVLESSYIDSNGLYP